MYGITNSCEVDVLLSDTSNAENRFIVPPGTTYYPSKPAYIPSYEDGPNPTSQYSFIQNHIRVAGPLQVWFCFSLFKSGGNLQTLTKCNADQFGAREQMAGGEPNSLTLDQRVIIELTPGQIAYHLA